MVSFRLQLRDAQLERPYLLLGSTNILGIEHADFLAIRPLTLDPVVGAVIRYINHVVCQTFNLKLFCGCVLSCELWIPSQPKEQSRARGHVCVLANLSQRYAIHRYAFEDHDNLWTVGVPLA